MSLGGIVILPINVVSHFGAREVNVGENMFRISGRASNGHIEIEMASNLKDL